MFSSNTRSKPKVWSFDLLPLGPVDLAPRWTAWSSGGSKILQESACQAQYLSTLLAHRHLSSTTFSTGRMPFVFSKGAGAPAREPSPRKRGPSGTCVNCAASRTCDVDKLECGKKGASSGHTVNGRTLIATLIEEAPSVAAMIACVG